MALPEYLTSVTVNKVWEDNEDQDGKRPESIKVQLYKNNEKMDGEEYSVDLNERNNWSYSWNALDVKESGEEISYSVQEVSIPTGYTAKISGSTTEGFTITNTYTTETISISGTKTWDDSNNQDGKRPSEITVNLYADGDLVEGKTVKESDDWAYRFENLPKYKDGIEITYTIKETAVEGYQTSYSGYNITNSYAPGATAVTITKIWDDSNNQDGRRDNYSVTIRGTVGDEEVYINTQNLDKDELEYTWENLAKYYNGIEITYTVDETNMPEGYTKEIAGDQETGFIITNSYTPETTKVSVTKVWDDNNNQDGKRDNYSITITGTVGDEQVYTNIQDLDKDELEYTWENLAKYYNGIEITYTVDETNMPEGYTKEITGNQETGFTITNSYTPETTKVSVTKIWDDSNDQDGKRDNYSITITGTVGDEEVYTNIQDLNKDELEYTWENLAKYYNGTEITYTVDETNMPEGYTKEITGNQETGFTITNSYTPVDKTIAPNPLPQTGQILLPYISLLGASAFAIILYIKFKIYDDIK